MTDAANEHQAAVAHKAVVEPLWTEPVFNACNPAGHIPDAVSVLVAEARCGYVPLHIVDDLAHDTRVIALDPSRAMLDQARQRVTDEMASRVFFVPQHVNSLSYADDVFRASICLNGVSTVLQAREAIAELSRVTAPGGSVTLAAPLKTAFPEFYDMLDEALRAHRLHDVLGRMYDLRSSLITPARLSEMADDVGLLEVDISEVRWDIEFQSGHELIMSPLVRETFFPHWIGIVRSSDREPVLRYVADAIDMYWHDEPFRVQVVAGCLSGMR
jgi:SAM-dependent methyltransferase